MFYSLVYRIKRETGKGFLIISFMFSVSNNASFIFKKLDTEFSYSYGFQNHTFGSHSFISSFFQQIFAVPTLNQASSSEEQGKNIAVLQREPQK